MQPATLGRLHLDRQFDLAGRRVRLFLPPASARLPVAASQANKTLPTTSRSMPGKKSDMSSRLETTTQPAASSRSFVRHDNHLDSRRRACSSRAVDSGRQATANIDDTRKVQTSRRYNIKILKDILARRQSPATSRPKATAEQPTAGRKL